MMRMIFSQGKFKYTTGCQGHLKRLWLTVQLSPLLVKYHQIGLLRSSMWVLMQARSLVVNSFWSGLLWMMMSLTWMVLARLVLINQLTLTKVSKMKKMMTTLLIVSTSTVKMMINCMINVEEGLENFEAEPPFEHTGNISSDEANSEDFDSLDEGEDNIEEIESNKKRKKRKPKFKTWKRQIDLKNPQFRIGMMFANKKEAKEAMEHHFMRTGRAIRLKKKNDKTRLRAIYEGSETCPFMILAARKNPSSDTFVIKTVQLEHQCRRVDKVLYADSRWLSEHYIDKLRTNPNWDVDDIMAEVRREFNLVVTRNQVFRAKRLAREVIKGSYVEQYARLWDYVEELKKANEGSTIKVKTQMDGDDILFQRIYVCLAGCKQGFLEGCRPIIRVDGCFIKGPHLDRF
ncbi:uncharacterized protein [Pyrus communis]|uniref:uncharacterized protein n=1 Tax=Pyrus communis TaxID=23211 RepID=UPI0035C10676